jgi:hypothetical protein
MSDEELALYPVTVNGEVVYVNRGRELWRWVIDNNRAPKFRKIMNKPTTKGYIFPRIGETHVMLHRLIASAFLGLDITDLRIQVDHRNGIRHDNRLENLRLVNNQQNQHNQTKALGYSWNKRKNKWRAYITLNGRQIHLGYFDIEEEARQAYLDAKLIHHKIP